METDFHLYWIVIFQISYLHHHPFWSSLGQECQPRIPWFLSSAVLHADLVPHTWERIECGIALDFESRLRPDPKTCLCGTQCVSVQGRTEISICCCCDRFWVPGHLPPINQNTYNSSNLSAAPATRNTDNTPFSSINAWTRLSFFFSHARTLHMDDSVLTGKSTPAACLWCSELP